MTNGYYVTTWIDGAVCLTAEIHKCQFRPIANSNQQMIEIPGLTIITGVIGAYLFLTREEAEAKVSVLNPKYTDARELLDNLGSEKQ